jgi:acyl-CoA synthetase (AMP-forming)/AMP-acid ligase II
MKIKAKTVNTSTDYYKNEVIVDIEPIDMDLDSVIQFFGEDVVANHLSQKSLVDSLDTYDLYLHMTTESIFKDREHDMINHLLDNFGEYWITDRISSDMIKTVHRERSVEELINN